jgi:hypothetical protein
VPQEPDRRSEKARRKVVDDRVQEPPDALVLERGAAQDGDDVARDRGLAHGRDALVAGRELALEKFRYEPIVLLADPLYHHGLGLQGFLQELRGDLLLADVDRPLLLVAVGGLHVDVVDDALEGVLGADGEDDRNGVGAQLLLDVSDDTVEVRADAVHLVDEGDTRDPVPLRLAPDRLGLRLHAADGAEERDAAVEDAERALDLGREVDAPRRIDDVDAVVLPVCGRRDGYARLCVRLPPGQKSSYTTNGTLLRPTPYCQSGGEGGTITDSVCWASSCRLSIQSGGGMHEPAKRKAVGHGRPVHA